MKNFLQEKKTNLIDKFETIGLGYLLALGAMILYTWLYSITHVKVDIGIFDRLFNQFQMTFQSKFGMFLFMCVLAPLAEEAIFRYFPLQIAKKLGDDYLLPIMIVSSVIFGYMHGSVLNVVCQGVIGFILSIVYVRNNYSYWSSVLLHSFLNLSLFWAFHYILLS